MIVEMGDYAWSEQWPAMSQDMNPIEHAWNFIGRKINQRNPKCQNIDELRTAILQEWQQFPQ
jgi:acyl carrier protein phosphodiesterase